MTEKETFVLQAFLKGPSCALHPIVVSIEPPTKTPEGSFICLVRCSALNHDPYPVYSGLEHDAWAKAFELLDRTLRLEGKEIVDKDGRPLPLPSPPRDRSWVPGLRAPDVTNIEPLYRVEGWAKRLGRDPQRVELAIWPPFEEEPGTFCAPTKCALRRDGAVICSYGAFPEQAVYLAYAYLRIETESYEIIDDQGHLVVVPSPPQPPLPKGS
jgi:hypothetical protein